MPHTLDTANHPIAQHQAHLLALSQQHAERWSASALRTGFDWARLWQRSASAWPRLNWPALAAHGAAQQERALLTLGVLRDAGDQFLALEAGGHEPVLGFHSEAVADGRALDRPVNYELLRLSAAQGSESPPVDASKSPIVIIDPRAGHGPGIGGFKPDSQVGVALAAGHPVYMIAFRDRPEPGQTITDVVAAHGQFVQAVAQAHPGADKPVVIGNCQGGWAGALMASQQPGRLGALVLNGSPLSYWAGRDGQNPMRYLGGLLGGALPAVLAADLAGGEFDGAHLVMNFEALNPANTWFRKYKDLFDEADTQAERFLQFDRWWSGFYRMNSAEIRWILSNLFIGNRLGKGDVVLDNGRPARLTDIDAPIFVFASWGDAITPPAQALGWLLDAYASDAAIAASGQRILYTLHEHIGHLGIFVSQQVARREHQAISSIIDHAHTLPPGLYEMTLEDGISPPVVRFHERRLADIRALGAANSAAQEKEFERVRQTSEWLEWFYDRSVAPSLRRFAQDARTPWHQWQSALHPLRLRRALVSSQNPWVQALAPQIDQARERVAAGQSPAQRQHGPAAALRNLDAQLTQAVQSGIEWATQARDAAFEMAFHTLWGSAALWPSQPLSVRAIAQSPMPHAPLAQWRQGDGEDALRAAVVRCVLLLIHARGGMRGSHLHTFQSMQGSAPEWQALSAVQRDALLREQAQVVMEHPGEALAELPALLQTREERARAWALLEGVVGKADQLSSAPQQMMVRIGQGWGIEALQTPTLPLIALSATTAPA